MHVLFIFCWAQEENTKEEEEEDDDDDCGNSILRVWISSLGMLHVLDNSSSENAQWTVEKPSSTTFRKWSHAGQVLILVMVLRRFLIMFENSVEGIIVSYYQDNMWALFGE